MANEKRLIDANTVLKWLKEITEPTEWLVSQYNADWIWGMIDSHPTVDAVEVVRCKDCKHCNDVSTIPFIADSQKLVCMKGANWRAVEPNHFCSYGERREGE